jgi:hypothetical protein
MATVADACGSGSVDTPNMFGLLPVVALRPMTDRITIVHEQQWTELRDDRGKLCARLDSSRLLLEIRRSDRELVAYFDLRDYLDELREVSVQSEAL